MAGLPFNGVRVLDAGELVAAAYATRLLAHLGASVVKLEDPGGDPLRERPPFVERGGYRASALQLFLDQCKRSVVREADPGGESTLGSLLRDADVLVISGDRRRILQRGFDPDQLLASYPSLIVVTITPFGWTGPRADWSATELIMSAAGGWLGISPGALDDPNLPPLKAFGQQCEFQGGVHGAIAAVAALFAREQRGGEGEHVDVSVQACIASNLEMNFMHWTYAGRETSRLGTRAIGPWGIIELADGPFFLTCIEEDQWQRLVQFLGNPDWAEWEMFGDRLLRAQHNDALMPLIEAGLNHLTCQDAFEQLQNHRIACTPVNTMEMLLTSDHLQEREFFVTVEDEIFGAATFPGAPFKMSNTPWKQSTRAPRLGEHSSWSSFELWGMD
ncbi:CaiB/BaiF CoA transferase family protein [Tepidiforma thermophila]|uniref:Formyl-CoA transferase n=1 Tax=Tepidiforma thermophila (strain KCTC 52669 / CGMCC 1.13589 / G233) TaxID=2761530 RepID=A0A2A9HFP9_TEPT2|nr:CoA transferase [Tepidiforma thermophila]PFG73816.1 formyl-CoA transferase [Tepidiforma thermophila]